MKTSKGLKIVLTIITVLISTYPSQRAFAGFKIFPLFQPKKLDLNYQNCAFHTRNLCFPRTLTYLEYTPVSKAEIIPDIDIDGDGIPNRVDNCPATFGSTTMKGCPPFDLTKSISYGNPTVRLKDEDFNLIVNIFSNLEFEGKQQSLSKRSQKDLNTLIKFLKKEKKLYLYISSYVNLSSNRMQNYYLSESRVQAVCNYLTKHGITSDRIGGLFFGDMMPVVDLPPTRFEVEICDKKKL
jgi:flagellar motor protein MotB